MPVGMPVIVSHATRLAWTLALCALAADCHIVLDIPDEVQVQDDDPPPDASAEQVDAGTQLDAPGDASAQTDAPIDIGDWWDSAYPYRAPLLVTAPTLQGPLQDVPVLVLVNQTRAPYIADTAETGLRFVADDGTPLDHQIEIWNPAGESYLWVRMPTMDSATTTPLWLYYGAPPGTVAVDPTAVWDGDYLAVWHLQEPVTDDATVGIHGDSTGNGHDGTQNRNGPISGPGIIGGAQDFDGNNDYITIPAENGFQSGYGQMTITARVFPRTNNAIDFQHIIAGGGSFSSGHYRQLFWQRDFDGWAGRYRAGGSDPLVQSFSGGLDQWAVVAMVYNGAQVQLYVDGQAAGAPRALTGNLSALTSFVIGGNPNADALDFDERDFDGYIDEVRISTTARSADWLLVQTESMNDNLVTYGQNQCQAGCP